MSRLKLYNNFNRVLKTKSLRVIDASIMPKIVNANTNIPSVLIGELGSKFILKEWEKIDSNLLKKKKR